MINKPYWPLLNFTEQQEMQYDAAWITAIEQAGGVNKLATQLSAYTGEYISHQAIRNWRHNHRIPPQWGLVIESYTEGKADFFYFCPWLRDRFKQKAA